MTKRNDLTQDERRAYNSMLARGYEEEDAYEAALDGVHIDDVREAGHVVKRDGLYVPSGTVPDTVPVGDA
jgi:hypothetical protein